MKNILLIGASGFVGSAILKEALERGHSVTALIRDPAKLTIRHPNLNAVSGNASSADEITCTAKGMDVVSAAYTPAGKTPISTRRYSPLTRPSSQGRNGPVSDACSSSGDPAPERHTGQESDRIGTDPASLLPGVKGQAEVYSRLLIPEKKLDWVFFSPSAELFSGKRTVISASGRMI